MVGSPGLICLQPATHLLELSEPKSITLVNSAKPEPSGEEGAGRQTVPARYALYGKSHLGLARDSNRLLFTEPSPTNLS